MDIIKLANYNNIYVHSSVEKELSKLLKGWSDSAKFQQWLFDRFHEIDDVYFDYRNRSRVFGYIDEFFAIKFRNKTKNLRLLCAVENEKIYVLLCAFDEKKSADYLNAKRLARDRFKKYKEEIGNEK